MLDPTDSLSFEKLFCIDSYVCALKFCVFQHFLYWFLRMCIEILSFTKILHMSRMVFVWFELFYIDSCVCALKFCILQNFNARWWVLSCCICHSQWNFAVDKISGYAVTRRWAQKDVCFVYCQMKRKFCYTKVLTCAEK